MIKSVDISDGNRLSAQHVNYILAYDMKDWNVKMYWGNDNFSSSECRPEFLGWSSVCEI